MLFILLGGGENHRNLAKNEFTQTAQVFFLPFSIPTQIIVVSLITYHTGSKSFQSHRTLPESHKIPSACLEKLCPFQSCWVTQMESRANLSIAFLVFSYWPPSSCFLVGFISSQKQVAHWGDERSQVPFYLFYIVTQAFTSLNYLRSSNSLLEIMAGGNN